MDKLIITCCVNDPRSFKDIKGLHMPSTVREVADAARAARDAGAAIVHVHEPITVSREGSPGSPVEAWLEVTRLIQQETDVIIQHGQGGQPYFSFEHRIPGRSPGQRQQAFDLKAEKPEMISFLLTEVDFAFLGSPNHYIIPTRDEMEKAAQICREAGVKPEYEVWHNGAYWNLQRLIDKGLVDPPHWLTFFFGVYSGVSGPPTIEELLQRVKSAPKQSLWEASVWSSVKGYATTQQQMTLITQAITLGGHVRIGLEDNPYLWDGVPAQSNAELVERVVRIARDIGREVATPEESRRIIGLPHKVNKSN